jgi:hypothetical protein
MIATAARSGFKFVMRIDRVHFGDDQPLVTSGNRCMALRRSSVVR